MKLLLLLVFLGVASCASLQELPDRALIEPNVVKSAIEFEKELNNRKEIPIPGGANWFEVVEGSIPVVITAPHSTRPLREGKRRFSDGGGTAALAKAIGELTGATVVYATYEGPSDPNYYDNNQFKKALMDIIYKTKPAYILDLHGSHPYRSYDVDIGTMGGDSLLGRNFLLHELVKHLRSEGINSISVNYFSASKNQTITKYSSHNGIPAMQLEINSTWVNPAKGNIEAQRFSRILQALVRFVKSTQR